MNQIAGLSRDVRTVITLDMASSNALSSEIKRGENEACFMKKQSDNKKRMILETLICVNFVCCNFDIWNSSSPS